MKDDHKTREQLIQELAELRLQNASLKKSESAEKYRSLVENLKDVIYELDSQGVVLYISPAIRDLLGFDSDEIVGKNFGDLAHKDDQSGLTEWFSELHKGKESPSEYRVIDKSGGYKWALTRARPIMEDGQFKGARGILIDVTKSKKIVEALRESEEKYRLTFENMVDVIYVIDANLDVLSVSPSVQRILGYKPQDFIGRPVSDLALIFTAESFKQAIADIGLIFKGETISGALYRFIAKDGTIKYGEVSSSPVMRDDKIVGIISVARDITERKQAEDALRENEEKYRWVLNNMADVITVMDMNLRFTYVSPSIIHMRGYTAEEAAAQTLEQVMTPESLQISAKVFEEELKLEASGTADPDRIRIVEVEQYRKDGSIVLMENHLSFMRDDAKKPVGIISASHDITQRRRAEETLRKNDIQLKKLTSWVPGMMYQFTKRPDGTFSVPFATEAVKDIFGCSPEDIREDFSPIARVILPEDLEKVVSSIEYSAEHLTIWTLEYRVQIPGQPIRWILGKSTPEKLADGSIAWYGFNTDITEIKKAEEALRKSEEEFRSLAESMPQIVWVTRKDGWNIYFNQQWIDYTGLTLEESYGHGWNIPFHPDDKMRAWNAWENATKNKGVYSLECRLRRTDGVYQWYLVRGVPLLDETGKIIKWFGTCTDIDKIKHTEEQLNDTLESLRKALGATIQVMVSAVEARDPYTSGHQTRSADLACAIATEMGLPSEKIEGIRMAGSIHDIGKLSIPAEILANPAKLSEIAFSLIKEHSRKGYEMLKDVESPWPLAEIVHQHHERMDGSGYPQKLKGEDILMEARILAVADVVEAMASHRPYRPSLGIKAALDEIEKNRETLYDKTVADACLRLFREKGFKLGGI